MIEPQFGLEVPRHCPGVPDAILLPKKTWADAAAYERTATKLSALFRENFAKYEEFADEEVRSAGPCTVQPVAST